MPVYRSGIVFVFVFGCYIRVSAFEQEPKSVVFSYASESHPHVATLSHHYRGPPETQFQNVPSGQRLLQNHPPSEYQNDHIPPSVGHDIPLPRQTPTNQLYQPASYPENLQYQGGHVDGIINHEDRPSDIYHPSIGTPTPFNDYNTLRPLEYESSTVVYHNHLPGENHNYYPPNAASELPRNYDLHRFDGHSTVPPDLGYSPTPIYYNDRPPDSNLNNHPPLDYPQEYYHSPTDPTYTQDSHHSNLTNNHLSHNPYHSNEQQFHDYTTPSPNYYSGNNYNKNDNPTPVYYDSPQSIPNVENQKFASNLTKSPPHVYYEGPSNQNFPDYQAPASIEYFDPPRGLKTFSPLPSSTPVYYEDENEYISTTPIMEFESVKESLPPIKDYPPPKPGYITTPFKHLFNSRKKVEREQLTRRPPKSSQRSVYVNDKVLQKPKYFAYSSDVLNDHNSAEGENEQVHDEEHDHEPKKKEEKYSKGAGQEHQSGHKATAGDKGDKGYESKHKHEEHKKGHHDKEDHKGKYVDEKGKKGKKEEEEGHYGEHHKTEKGKKAAKYGESGEHKKGHSTKGEHNIHKMDEYMKKHEFYDEHHEGGDHEKFGGFKEAHVHKKGGKKKKGHHKSGHHQKHKGKKGHHEKKHKLGHHQGHKDAKGYDGHFSKHKKYGKKGGSKNGMKWGYSKGHPPK